MLLRMFDEHGIRRVIPLSRLWEFVTEPERTDRGKVPSHFAGEIFVPSAWEAIPGRENYRGKAWLRTIIPSDNHRALRLVFGGVSHTATVYIDGQKVGHHHDAFTPWDVVVPVHGARDHELIVEVDNSFGPLSALHKENDYYTYGGITRPAVLEHVPEVYIDKIFATPVRKGSRWDLDVRVRLRNWSRKPGTRRLTVLLEDLCLDLGELTVPAQGSLEASGAFKRVNATPWTPQDPRLYGILALLVDENGIADDLIDRVGFREIRVQGRKILLNGKPLRLRGYCRHEDHPQFGCALPIQAMLTDLEILRDQGCNFVRTAHYPNDMRFLDLCDEMGFFVWEEVHARGVDFKHPRFRRQITASATEMVEWHMNHPSVIIWSGPNECDSVTPAGYKEYEHILKLIKRLDSSRPVTFASNKAERDTCLKLVDIVSWNRYDAWYHGKGVERVEPDLKAALAWLHSTKSRGGTNKPVIMSEFGAGALYGCRNRNMAKWTEEYQALALDKMLEVYLNHPDIAGCSIWQFCDVRIAEGEPDGEKGAKRFLTRPRTMNNKGTVDEYRRPKLAYDVVSERMHEAIERWDKKG